MESGRNSKKSSLTIPIPEENEDEVAIPLQSALDTPSSPTVQFYRSIFDRADTDGDGRITIQELQAMISRHELSEEPLSPSLVKRIHQVADTDRNGQLDFNEFVYMINDPEFRSLFGCYVTKYINFIIPRKKHGGCNVPGFVPLYEDEYSCSPPKLGMIVISIIELVFFLTDEFIDKTSAMGPLTQLFVYDPAKRYQLWRYLTYMFVHIGHLHLTVNVIIQMFIGLPLEMVHGWWRVLTIYFAGVVAGSLGTSVMDPTTKLAGASGGVYALITAHMATIIMNWEQMSFPGVRLLIFLIITGVDVGTSIFNRYYDNKEEHIGFVSHFAGGVAGLLVGIVILRNLKLTKHENVLWWIAVAVFVMLMLAGICWNIFYTDYFPKQI